MKTNRRNFLKQASTVLGALALCPAVLIPKKEIKSVSISLIFILPDGTELCVNEPLIIKADKNGNFARDWEALSYE